MTSRRFNARSSRAPTERIAHLGTAAACCAAGFQSSLCLKPRRMWTPEDSDGAAPHMGAAPCSFVAENAADHHITASCRGLSPHNVMRAFERLSRQSRSQIVHITNREVETRGLSGGLCTDLYHHAMTVSWPAFFAW